MNEKKLPKQLDSEMGVYRKYIVTKSDGTSCDPDARYIVLRIDKPRHHRERKALELYAVEQIRTGNGRLGVGLLRMIQGYRMEFVDAKSLEVSVEEEFSVNHLINK